MKKTLFQLPARAFLSLVVALVATLQAGAAAAAPVTEEMVGDADSFGRNVRYLGVAQTIPIQMQDDCTGAPPEVRCVTLAAAPAVTTFTEVDLESIELPGRSTKSLICFAVTPFVSFQFQNDTGVSQPSAQFNVTLDVTIENELLDDAALINPQTGLPFGGELTVPLSTYRESRSMAAGERAFKQLTLSRNCVGGIVSKESLAGTFGLPEDVVEDFFKKDILVRFGARGTAQLVSFANDSIGVRLYGD